MNGKAAELGCDDDTYFPGRPTGWMRRIRKAEDPFHDGGRPGADPQILYLTLPGEGRIPLPSQKHRPTPFLTSPNAELLLCQS